ncbi:MAG: hypothetical protein HY905_08920 [Deltaproteobacteria bacterium]|nr:hypothetical protein [Deltaproteobacteria bacterium]
MAFGVVEVGVVEAFEEVFADVPGELSGVGVFAFEDELAGLVDEAREVGRGPRQVGKTTLLLELAERHGEAAIYAAADGPEAAASGFWERIWVRAEETAGRVGRAGLPAMEWMDFLLGGPPGVVV